MKELFLLTITFLLVSCGKQNQGAAERRDVSELNVRKFSTLQTRGDNYEKSCLYLTEYDRSHNECIFLLENSEDIDGTLVTDDVSNFSLLEEDSFTVKANLGDRIKAGTYTVGDVYSLVKSDSSTRVKIIFKVIEINPSSNIKIEYQVKEYTIL